jgi:hypothetical protein
MLLYNMLLLKCVRNDDYGHNDNVEQFGKIWKGSIKNRTGWASIIAEGLD